jgi:hypothetical protein
VPDPRNARPLESNATPLTSLIVVTEAAIEDVMLPPEAAARFAAVTL